MSKRSSGNESSWKKWDSTNSFTLVSVTPKTYHCLLIASGWKVKGFLKSKMQRSQQKLVFVICHSAGSLNVHSDRWMNWLWIWQKNSIQQKPNFSTLLALSHGRNSTAHKHNPKRELQPRNFSFPINVQQLMSLNNRCIPVRFFYLIELNWPLQQEIICFRLNFCQPRLPHSESTSQTNADSPRSERNFDHSSEPSVLADAPWLYFH